MRLAYLHGNNKKLSTSTFWNNYGFGKWEASEFPEPSAILDSAVADKQAGRFATALLKYKWYHSNALDHEPSQYGVRLSFALMYWYDLAKQYPPAMNAFLAYRDAATKHVASETGKVAYELFNDAMAFNRKLNDDASTSALFLKLHEKNPSVAKLVYGLAQSSLVKSGDYEVCDIYLDAEIAIDRLIELFRMQRHDPPRTHHQNRQQAFAQKSFRFETANLIALLWVNGHTDAAKLSAKRILKESSDPKLTDMIDRALLGNFPEDEYGG